jgi:glycosyltransferase involved in cell wall biosynthesis
VTFRNLRVALIGPLPPPAGGMANQTRQLAELLRGEGAAVEIVQTNAPYRPAVVGRILGLRAAFRLMPYLIRLWRAAGRSDVFHVMANSGWSWHLFAAPAVWIAHARGVPAVVNYRGGEAATFLAQSAGTVRFTMRRAARLIVPSAFLQNVFARFGMVAQVAPNVIDLSRFFPRVGDRLGPRAAHLVVARNLEPLYDNATALRAFALVRERLSQARLTIAGSGPEADALHTLAASLGLADAVTFTGRLDRDAMAHLYRDADVVLNPSLADNMPNSVLEALASGVPVVSTNVGGVPYLVQHGVTALLVPPADPARMAAAALDLLVTDAKLWRRLSAAGITEVEKYAWTQVAPLLADAYSRAAPVCQG